MKKLIPLILIAPFIIVTFYFGLDKYMTFLFGQSDGLSFVSMMLTMLVTVGFILLCTLKEINK